MKYLLLITTIAVGVLINSCKKESGCTPVNPDAEQAQINDFTVKTGISLNKDNRGIYYNVIDTGSTVSVSRSSKVSIVYTARFLNNKTFDSTSSPKVFALNELIEGLQMGLQLVKKGGRIQLVIPSAYAYGCTGNGNLNVPSDSVLFFDITLLDVR